MKLPPLLAGRRRRVFARLVANGFLQAGAASAIALLVRRGFDDLLAGTAAPSGSDLWASLGSASIAVIALALLRRRERIDSAILAQSYAHRLRRAMYARLCATTPLDLQRLSRGAVLLRFLGDLNAITQWISHGYARLLVAAVTATATLAALALLQWQMALAITAILAGGLGATLALGRRFDSAARAARERRTALASNIAEKVTTLPVVQALGQSRREQQRLRLQSRRLKRALIARSRPAGTMTAVAEATAALAVIGALAAGALAVGARVATPGTVLAFTTIVGFIAAPLRELGRAYERWLRAVISREKLAGFLAGASRHRGRRPLPPGPGALELADLAWGETLRGASAVAAARARIVITGGTGSGKSALLYLIAGMLQPDRGTIRLDGHDVATVRAEELRSAIGLVTPDLPLLRGTVDDNLGYGAPDAAPGTRARVAQLCDLGPLLAQLPAGGASRVAAGGANLSLGQRQRIALARAMLGEPRVLLIDGVDQALDDGLRQVLLRVFARYRGTVVVVTRDAQLLERATDVWDLADGRLCACAAPGGNAGPAGWDTGEVAFI